MRNAPAQTKDGNYSSKEQQQRDGKNAISLWPNTFGLCTAAQHQSQ